MGELAGRAGLGFLPVLPVFVPALPGLGALFHSCLRSGKNRRALLGQQASRLRPVSGVQMQVLAQPLPTALSGISVEQMYEQAQLLWGAGVQQMKEASVLTAGEVGC